MSICALWVIAPQAKLQDKKCVLFSRHYPTVKKRAKHENADFAELPTDVELAEAIIDEMQIHRANTNFIKEFDSCAIQKQTPMYAVNNGTIWPIVAIMKYGLLFACLPFVKHTREELHRLNYKEIGPCVIAYSLLQSIGDLIGPSNNGIEVSEEKLQELRDYLFVCMPFGTPLEMDSATVRGILYPKDSGIIPKQKVPAWRPSSHKGKQQINLFISEQVRCIQYDKTDMPDVCEVFGTINCKADMEGAPEISMNLLCTSETSSIFTNMVYHHCVQLSDTLSPAISEDDRMSPDEYRVRSIRFFPPLESFCLCHYKSNSLVDCLPIMAYYEMTEKDNVARVKIQLKLWKMMKNSFDHLIVDLPFFNRRPIIRYEFSPQSANVTLLNDRRTLRWNAGTKFPSKTLQLSLEGAIQFSTADEPVTLVDGFCVGLNAYIYLRFKVNDFTYSGLKVDNPSISIYPSSKFKSNFGSEFISSEYQIWNSLGDALGYEKQTEANR